MSLSVSVSVIQYVICCQLAINLSIKKWVILPLFGEVGIYISGRSQVDVKVIDGRQVEFYAVIHRTINLLPLHPIL